MKKKFTLRLKRPKARKAAPPPPRAHRDRRRYHRPSVKRTRPEDTDA